MWEVSSVAGVPNVSPTGVVVSMEAALTDDTGMALSSFEEK